MKKEELRRIGEDRDHILLPLCPLCGELTDLRGESLPCCGGNIEKIDGKHVEWVKLEPIGFEKPTAPIHTEAESYEVVFKAGYEIRAENKDKAVEKARSELRRELFEDGASRFVIDVDEEPYPE